MIRRLAVQVPGVNVRQVERLIEFPGGGSIQVRSADNPDSLRGEGLDFLVMDECAFIHEDAWAEALRPALADRKGRALFISTPKGRNWFWRLWHNADGVEVQAWRFSSYDNPYLDPKEIDAARASLPERVFQQEFEAAFLDSSGGVFRRVMEAATAQVQERPHREGEYVFGVDWARDGDFTAIAVFDLPRKELVYLDRFNQIDYAVQLARLNALYERFKPVAIVAEANSMGGPLVESMRRSGLPVRPFTTTNATKAQVIEALALAFEQGSIKIIPDPVLIAELQAYELERLPSGLIRYGAPASMHDDTVIALALAYYAASNSQRRPRVREY